MSECSKCGKQSMSFTCRYCGEKFCSEHRLPENHDCEAMDGETPEKHEEWFEGKFSEDEKNESREQQKKKSARYTVHRKSLSSDIIESIKGNYTLGIIGLTVLSFIIQLSLPQQVYFDQLVLNPQVSELLTRPWSLFTVMLLHAAPFHLFANMITFYFFGTPLERLIGGREMLRIYLISGLVASLAYIGFYNLLILIHGTPSTAGLAVGASGAVVAIVGVIAKLYPDAEVLLYFIVPMKIKTAVYAFGAIETVNLLAKLAGVQLPLIGISASSAHLAGLLIGLYYGDKLQEKYRKNTSVFDPLGP
ncbi:MAG: rhomboid family intramembrane serine protease [Candidatus Nanohaloarchaea archaeon]